jgi:hypothetical protein
VNGNLQVGKPPNNGLQWTRLIAAQGLAVRVIAVSFAFDHSGNPRRATEAQRYFYLRFAFWL